jgi:hypothetical protein
MTDRDHIHTTLDQVRRRWRFRLALESLVPVVATVVAFLVVWVLIWPAARDRAAVISVARWVTALGIATLVGIAAHRWRRRRPSDTEVALYVEERAPALEQALVSSLAAEQDQSVAPGLAERVLASARQGLSRIDDGRQLERERVRRAGGWVGALTLGSAALFFFGPDRVRDATTTLVNPWRPVPTAPSFLVAVTPGNVEVPKGGGVDVAAQLNGFSSEAADLVFRADSAAEWERLPMARDTALGRFSSRLLDLGKATDYFVESQGIRSPTFRLTVVDLPAIHRTNATIQFPGYTGLAPESIEDAGDLAVLRGSTVSLTAATTRPAQAAVLVVEGRPAVPMKPTPSGGWSAAIRVSGDAFWRIDLETDDGRVVTGLQYAIDALEDSPPSARFRAPGRDTKVSSIEEVTTEVEAADDFGVRKLILHASVNGGPEKAIPLADTSMRALRDLSAAHTFFLEEWTLTPGDLVSYYAEAVDGAGQSGKSDIYFLEVRPFDKSYREAEQAGGGGGGGGESAEGLSERQRQIVVGTFNVLRDSADQKGSYRENITTLAIGEGRLREDVNNLTIRLRQRQMASVDSTFLTIARELDSAKVELQEAEERLGRQRPREALPPAQRALQHLQRAEAAYREVQVSMGQNGGGGGGGQQQQNADELADLFELETDKLRNQYESVQRESGEQAERQLDETLEKLRRLASRQQQENERMERMADALRNRSQQSGGGGGGGGSQRQLASEAEEQARQLERLAREQNNQGLADAARRLREAAEEMRRAASSNPQGGSAQGNAALERLKNATRQLERSRTEGRQEAIRQLQAKADQLRADHRDAAEQAGSLPADPAQRGDRLQALGARKDALAREVDRLEADAERLSREAAREQPKAARKLAEAAEGLRANRVRDKVLFSKNLAQRGSPEYVRTFEEGIGQNLAETADKLREAAGSLEESGENRQAKALDRARDLVRGLESLNERARAAQRRAEAGTGESGQRRSGEQGADNPRDGQSAEGRRNGETTDGQQRDSGQQSGREGAGQQGGRQEAGQQSGGQQRGGQRGEGRQAGEGRPGGEGQQAGERATGGQAGEGRGERPNETPPSSESRRNPTGQFDNDGLRQFSREFRARRQAAESLRADLRALGEATGDLDRLLEQFRALDTQTTFGDARGLDRLERDLIDGLKELEFSLWRRFGESGGQRPAAGASARVPAQYRDQVEEYYRSLARHRPGKP